jgi:hypothetical protein
MNKGQLLETITDLVLQSITVWEEVHLNALSLSTEYSAFWDLLDGRIRETALKYQKRNREARLSPFSISHIKYYELLMTRENYVKIRGLHWKEQLKLILSDARFRSVLAELTAEFRSVRERDYGYVSGCAAVSS